MQNDSPEKITLRRLAPEHVLRRCDFYIDSMGHVNAAGSVGRQVSETARTWYCHPGDWPQQYDKPAIDAGEGWRLLEPDELVQYGDQFLSSSGEWMASTNWFNGRPQQIEPDGIRAYRRRITPQPDRLTELRQQGERQAKRIEELEHILSQYKQLFQHAIKCVVEENAG